MTRGAAVALLALAAAVSAAGADRGASASLSVRQGDEWRVWWSAQNAPARWATVDTLLTRTLRWKRAADGVEWATARLACSAPAWRQQLVVLRIDPARVRLSLEQAFTPDGRRPAWTIDRAPRDAVAAFNAGQFVQTLPWGWLVRDGHQDLAPGVGPLSRALTVHRSGRVGWIAGDSLAEMAPLASRGADPVVNAFQSYPTLLEDDGRVPVALSAGGRGVNLMHRDARLAIGEARDGRLIVAMTRFDALGGAAGRVPLGLTTPEMAAVMGALGAREAVMLDGGISAQMLLREGRGGRVHRWPGMRTVPLALVVRARE